MPDSFNPSKPLSPNSYTRGSIETGQSYRPNTAMRPLGPTAQPPPVGPKPTLL